MDDRGPGCHDGIEEGLQKVWRKHVVAIHEGNPVALSNLDTCVPGFRKPSVFLRHDAEAGILLGDSPCNACATVCGSVVDHDGFEIRKRLPVYACKAVCKVRFRIEYRDDDAYCRHRRARNLLGKILYDFAPAHLHDGSCPDQVPLLLFVGLQELVVALRVADKLCFVVDLLVEHVLLPLGDVAEADTALVQRFQVGRYGVQEVFLVVLGLFLGHDNQVLLRNDVLADFGHEAHNALEVHLGPNTVERPHLFPVELEYGFVRGVLRPQEFLQIFENNL